MSLARKKLTLLVDEKVSARQHQFLRCHLHLIRQLSDSPGCRPWVEERVNGGCFDHGASGGSFDILKERNARSISKNKTVHFSSRMVPLIYLSRIAATAIKKGFCDDFHVKLTFYQGFANAC